MVIVVVSGGLGSQLCQYSTGLSLANKKKGLLIVDAAWYSIKNKKLKKIPYLNLFDLIDVKKKIIIKNINVSRVLRAFLIFLNLISFGFIKYKKINIKNPLQFKEFPNATNYFINGYPNNFKYYKDSYKARVLKELNTDTYKEISNEKINIIDETISSDDEIDNISITKDDPQNKSDIIKLYSTNY